MDKKLKAAVNLVYILDKYPFFLHSSKRVRSELIPSSQHHNPSSVGVDGAIVTMSPDTYKHHKKLHVKL